MEGSQRDDTQDWQLSKAVRPPLLKDLVDQVDEALTTARASESAVMSVGAAALDAAEQARRAAELAEEAADRAGAAVQLGLKHNGGGSKLAGWPDDRQRRFSQRADRIVARLRELQRR